MELLAPAGELNTAIAAFQAGADACYIGGEMSARAYAKNFSKEDVGEALRLARLWGRKLYVALNTMIFEEEMEQALNTLAFYAFRCGCGHRRTWAGEKPVGYAISSSDSPQHAGRRAYGLWRRAGERAWLRPHCGARECTFQQLETLAKKGVEVEAFCHGALCSSVSGMCLMSLYRGQKRQIRALGAQPCRMEYMLEGERAYWLSTADLCTIESLSKFIDAGVF